MTWLPALRAALAIGVGAWSVAALAIGVSLALPRAATLLVLGGLGTAVVAIEAAGIFGARMDGIAGAVAGLGPAWVAAPVSALAPWLRELHIPGPPEWPVARAIAWAGIATAALLARFRRVDLPR